MALELWMLLGVALAVILLSIGLRRIYRVWVLKEEAKKLMVLCRDTLYHCAPHITNRPTEFKALIDTRRSGRIFRKVERRIILRVFLIEEDHPQVESIVTECVTGLLEQKGNEKLFALIDYKFYSPQLEKPNGTVREKQYQ